MTGSFSDACASSVAHQRRRLAVLPQPEIGPGALLIAVDQFGLAEQFQMPRNAGLRLAENFGKIGHGQVAGGKKRQETQARRLAGRLQDVHQRIQSKSHRSQPSFDPINI